jgi:hypothetical protein
MLPAKALALVLALDLGRPPAAARKPRARPVRAGSLKRA